MSRANRKPGKNWATEPVTADPCGSSPGFFKRKLVRGGPEVPCQLFTIEDRDDETGELLSDVIYCANVDGVPCPDALSPPGWPWTKISESDWQFMTDDARWAREHAPDSPKAQPTRAATESPKQYF